MGGATGAVGQALNQAPVQTGSVAGGNNTGFGGMTQTAINPQAQGGKSSGLGQGGYGGAPGFGGGRGQMDFGVIRPTQFGQQPQPQQDYYPPNYDPDRFSTNLPSLDGKATIAPYRDPTQFGGAGDMEYRGGPATPAQNAFRAQRAQQMGGQQQLAQARDNYLQSNPAFQQGRQLQASFGGNQPTQEQQAQLENLSRQVDQDPGIRQFQQRLQQQQMQQQFRPQQQGIQQLLNQMMMRFQPQMQQRQMPMQAPQQRSQALQYRPNMTQAQQALSRVKPSVQKQEQDAQVARIAELEGQLAGFQRPNNDYGGGG